MFVSPSVLATIVGLSLIAVAPPAGALMQPDPDPDPTREDRTPPTIHLTYPEGGHDGWFSDTRTVSFEVTDQGTNGGVSSRVAEIHYELSGATADEGIIEGRTRFDVTISAEGSTQLDLTAYDGNRNHASQRIWVGVDRTAPAVTLAAPLDQDGAEFALDSRVEVGYACADAHSGLASCTGTHPNGALLDTSAPGIYTTRVSATDHVGNVRTRTVNYRVRPGVMGVLTPPRLVGEPRVGQVLRAEAPTFAPAPASVEHQWYRDGYQLIGADEPTYRVTPADSGAELHYVAVAHLARHESTRATSSPLTVLRPLAAQGDLTVRGTARVGEQLVARLPILAEPTFPARADVVTYQWLRNGAAIRGATTARYRPQAADVGARISVRATAGRPGHESVHLTSAPTGRVAKGVVKLSTRVQRKGSRTAVLKIRTTGPVAATGRIEVRRKGRTLARATLRKGRATVKVQRPRRGKQALQVRYLGSAHLSATTIKVVVR